KNSICSNHSVGIQIDNELADNNFILSNHIWSSNQGQGIILYQADNTVIRSNTIRDQLYEGIKITGSVTNSYLSHNNIFSNWGSGVLIESNNADHNLVYTNEIWGLNQWKGLFLVGGDNNVIQSNRIHENEYGIYIQDQALNNRLVRNDIYQNDSYGIFITNSGRNAVIDSKIWGNNQDYGVCVRNASSTVIRSNQIYYINSGAVLLNAGGRSNIIAANNIYSNQGLGIDISSDTVDDTVIFSNRIYHPTGSYGLRINEADRNIVRKNIISHAGSTGIKIWINSVSNYISGNTVYSNDTSGIDLSWDALDYNTISSNIVFGRNQNDGIVIEDSDNNYIYRNLVYDNQYCGIRLSATASSIRVINNTIFGSVNSNGLMWLNTSSGTMYNNVILSNNRYGVESGTSGTVYAAYNDIYGNGSGTTTGSLSMGPGNLYQDPRLETVTSFTIASALSPCVDRGMVIAGVSGTYQGTGPDMGWKESPFTFTNHGPFYVDDNSGLDTNPGTFESPFATIQKAVNIMMPGVTTSTCYIFPGAYDEAVVIFSNRNTGYMVFTKLSNKSPQMGGGGIRSEAIIFTNASRVMINGLKISNYTSSGIVLRGTCTNNIISRNYIKSCTFQGIYLLSRNCDRNYFYTNHVISQSSGIRLDNGDQNTFASNIVRLNALRGIYLDGSSMSNRFTGGSVYSNTSYGISFESDNADYNFIENCRICGRGQQTGINIDNGDFNIIRKNIICRHSQEGVVFGNSATTNHCSGNSIYSNDTTGISLSSCTFNSIMTNSIWGANQDTGISINVAGYNNTIMSNQIHNNQNTGVELALAADYNVIRGNSIYSNPFQGIGVGGADYIQIVKNVVRDNGYGIDFNSISANNEVISSNILQANRNSGLKVEDADYVSICRNLVSRNVTNGIVIKGTVDQARLVNNTIYGTVRSNGILWQNSSVGTMLNNIILSNGNGLGDYGIRNTSSGSVILGYNDLFGNPGGPTNGGYFLVRGGNIFQDPMLETVTSFTITSASSLAVDSATNVPDVTASYMGLAPDMGWKESGFTRNSGPYYVDDNSGLDTNPGTFSQPFLTIQRAADAMSPGAASAICYIFPGQYNNKTTVLSNKNSGYMVFTGLSNSPPRLHGGLGPMMTNFAFKITNAGRIMVTGLAITNFQNAIIIQGTSRSNIISRNRIKSSGGMSMMSYCIKILSDQADYHSIRSNEFWATGTTAAYGVYIDNGDNNLVYSNRIHNSLHGIGIIGSAQSNNIINNDLYDNTQAGLSMDSSGAGNNQVLSNRIYGNSQSMGIILSNGMFNVIRYNRIYRNSSDGIHVCTTASNMYLLKNTVFSNESSGIFLSSQNGNYIMTNYIWGTNQDYGIYIQSSKKNTVRSNQVHHNGVYGIYVQTIMLGLGYANNNLLTRNLVYSNGIAGIADRSAGIFGYNNSIISNVIYGENQDYGIWEDGSRNNSVYRNLVRSHQVHGIKLTATSSNIRIFNNTIFKSIVSNGITCLNSSKAEIINNIILSNNLYGIHNLSSRSQVVAYNDLYGSLSDPTNGGRFLWGAGNKFTDPLLDTVSSFTITSASGAAVDSASNIPGVSDNFQGMGPDMGWKESPFTGLNYGPYYVDDNNGLDTNPGTFSQPFRTIQKAALAMMPGLPNCSSAITYIFPGIYQERVTIKSNKNTGYMLFTKLSNSMPVLTGVSTTNHGIKMTNACRVAIHGLVVKSYSTHGIILVGASSNNRISRNNIYSNNSYGINIDSEDADKNYILTNNVWSRNQDRPVYIGDGDNNVVRSNQIHSSQYGGIQLDASATGNWVVCNSIYSNNTHNVYISAEGADNNYIISNHIWGAGGGPLYNGIYLVSADNMVIRDNRIHAIMQYGIQLATSPTNNTIERNTIYSNELAGIYLNSAGVRNKILTNQIY
ncbi:MAG: right-handed parallel beta-helix repeat-containing protein, partial [bacterium]|nr:right-handed parallel beta-helix repeat-containing protein [bacterium]